ncbi:MAG: chorismate-binding protein [Actinomycetota bacterium]|nr:chorismate-binding protein [Actinomycetota bacterium]
MAGIRSGSMSREAFAEAARGARMVPVFRELLADELTPVALYRALATQGRHSFLLESVERGERWSRYSFVGSNPLASLSLEGGEVALSSGSDWLASVFDGRSKPGFLGALEAMLEALSGPSHPDLGPLQSGFVGFIGYDVVREIEDLPTPNPDPVGFPDAEMALIGDIACFDHLSQRIFLVANTLVEPGCGSERLDDLYTEALGRLDSMESRLASAVRQGLKLPADPPAAPANLLASISSRGYRDAVGAAKEHILAGDIFQVVLSKRYSFDLGCDPFTFYRVLRLKNPSPYMYFLDFPRIKVAGSSPEPLVRVEGRRVVSRPIAGTRPRGASDEEDRRLAAELAEHPKELAEHVMLVDLARNDLGRVSEFGSESIDELMTLERYSRVMHLTSQVSATRRDEVSMVDVLRATMPAGTVSGAPKVRAMEIINDLEPVKRGPYAGVVGYFDLAGNMDVAIAIRTLFVEPGGRAHLQAGAGIVYDSDPSGEDAECDNKARALLEAAAIASGAVADELPAG